MTPQELHRICHEACYECPQFRGYDDDMYLDGFGEFGEIPNKGIVPTIKFWRNNKILWESGYSVVLPVEVQEIFEKIDELLDAAIKKALK